MKTEIKEQIKEVNSYFVQKLMSGEYTIISFETGSVKIKIDGHDFCLWISNIYENFECYEHSYNFMNLSFTSKQRMFLHSQFNIDRDKQKRELIEKQMNELNEELKSLK